MPVCQCPPKINSFPLWSKVFYEALLSKLLTIKLFAFLFIVIAELAGSTSLLKSSLNGETDNVAPLSHSSSSYSSFCLSCRNLS